MWPAGLAHSSLEGRQWEGRGGGLGKAGSHFSVPALNPSHSGDKCGTSFSGQVRKLRLPSTACPVSITWSHATPSYARTARVWSWQWPTLDCMAGSGNKTGRGGEWYKLLHPVSLSDPFNCHCKPPHSQSTPLNQSITDSSCLPSLTSTYPVWVQHLTVCEVS